MRLLVNRYLLESKNRRKLMLSKFLLVLMMVSVIGLFPVNALGEDNTGQKEVPVFTNQDIEKYKKSSDSKPPVAKVDKTEEKRERSQEIKEEHEKEYWCKKATQYKRKIEKEQDEVSEIEKELSADIGHKKKTALEKKLKNSRKKLKYAEKDLAELEDEAHRGKIPPGWLRCQFE